MEELSREVSVDEMQYNGLFIIQDEDMLVVADAPDWVRYPITGEKLYIKHRWVADQDVRCPNCGESGRHGLITLENDLIIVCCKVCKKFTWVEIAFGG